MSEIEKWLKKHNLSEYTHVFQANKIDFVVLDSLTANDLEQIGINKLSDRLRIMRLIKKQKGLKSIEFYFSIISPCAAIVLFFVPFFDFSTLENAVYKDVSGIQMIHHIGAILKDGIGSSIEKMYLFSMLILPISVIEILFILSYKQDDMLYTRGCGFLTVHLGIICINVYFVAISLGFNKDGIGFYEYGEVGFFVYLLFCIADIIVSILTSYNSGDQIKPDYLEATKSAGVDELPLSVQLDKELLRQLMSRNRIADVFDALEKYYQSIQKAEPDDLLLLKGQYEESRRMKNLGIIEHLENKEENRIKLAVLELMEKI
jgi:SAM domain (Sterile alpha motif)/Effector-associated domain 11